MEPRYVILIRIPKSGRVQVIVDNDENYAVTYATRDEAEAASAEVPAIKAGFPYVVVEAP